MKSADAMKLKNGKWVAVKTFPSVRDALTEIMAVHDAGLASGRYGVRETNEHGVQQAVREYGYGQVHS